MHMHPQGIQHSRPLPQPAGVKRTAPQMAIPHTHACPACMQSLLSLRWREADGSPDGDPTSLQLPHEEQPDSLSPGMQPLQPRTATAFKAQPLMPQFHLTPVATASSFRTPGTQTAPSTPLSRTLTRQASDHSMDMSPPSTPAQVAVAAPPSMAAVPQVTPRTRQALMAGLLTGVSDSQLRTGVRERFWGGRRGRSALSTPRGPLAGTRHRSHSEDGGLQQGQEAAAESALADLEARWHGGDGGADGGMPRQGAQLGVDPGGAARGRPLHVYTPCETVPASRRLHCSSACAKSGCCRCAGSLCSHGVPGGAAADGSAHEGGASTSKGELCIPTSCSARACRRCHQGATGDWPSLHAPACCPFINKYINHSVISPYQC